MWVLQLEAVIVEGCLNIGVKMLSAQFVNSVLLGRRNNSNSCFLWNNCPLRRCQNRLAWVGLMGKELLSQNVLH